MCELGSMEFRIVHSGDIDVCVWRYALLVVLATHEEEEEDNSFTESPTVCNLVLTCGSSAIAEPLVLQISVL